MSRLLPSSASAAAFVLLMAGLTGCGASSPLGHCLPGGAPGVKAADLAGTYQGRHEAKGTAMTLVPVPDRNGGTMTVENWPTGDHYRAELGDTFKGSGTWEVDEPMSTQHGPLVHLYFTRPHDWMSGDTVDLLTVAGDSTRTVLYEDADPDICPDFRLDRAT
ncbi:hypothetical protein ACGFW5_30230 [Streptomyces sp. NPDC048416]|uniref:hypothetical protein n=1 Tax=Streptomyces sp. NPDC048416 TaxID=3365546 RepID=UPI00371684B7